MNTISTPTNVTSNNSVVKEKRQRRIPQPKTVWVVVELAYHDDYLSGVDVVGVFTSRHKVNRIAKRVTVMGPCDQYEYRGKVYEIIML